MPPQLPLLTELDLLTPLLVTSGAWDYQRFETKGSCSFQTLRTRRYKQRQRQPKVLGCSLGTTRLIWTSTVRAPCPPLQHQERLIVSRTHVHRTLKIDIEGDARLSSPQTRARRLSSGVRSTHLIAVRTSNTLPASGRHWRDRPATFLDGAEPGVH